MAAALFATRNVITWTPRGTDGVLRAFYNVCRHRAGNVAAGTLDAARGTLPLITLGALTLIGTAGIVIRRNRRRDSEI